MIYGRVAAFVLYLVCMHSYEFVGEGVVEKFTNGMVLVEEWFEEWMYVSV